MKLFALPPCFIIGEVDDVDNSAASIEEILEKHADMVFRLCTVYMRNRADAEDSFQNVFLKLYKADPEFNGEEHIKAWLLKVTANECKNRLKSFWHRNIIAVDEIVLPVKDRNNREIIESLLTLPMKYRNVLYLHYFEGYSVREMSQILGLKESTVKTHLKRGRESLKPLLFQGGYDHE